MSGILDIKELRNYSTNMYVFYVFVLNSLQFYDTLYLKNITY